MASIATMAKSLIYGHYGDLAILSLEARYFNIPLSPLKSEKRKQVESLV